MLLYVIGVEMTTILIACIVFAFLLIAFIGWRKARRGYELPDVGDEEKNGWTGFMGE